MIISSIIRSSIFFLKYMIYMFLTFPKGCLDTMQYLYYVYPLYIDTHIHYDYLNCIYN